MRTDEIDGRLAAAAERVADLSRQLAAGGPWPLSERFDHAPEASWGPHEILAHLGEMLGYWLGELERVVDMPDGPAPFGRIATDDVRLAILARDRTLPIRELLTRVQSGLVLWRERWPRIDSGVRSRTGLHPSLGEVDITEIATRFVVGHIEDHLDQLEAALAGGRDAG